MFYLQTQQSTTILFLLFFLVCGVSHILDINGQIRDKLCEEAPRKRVQEIDKRPSNVV